jgi:ArsR family transcriptional regulator, virulence genes transcriptional regulator
MSTRTLARRPVRANTQIAKPLRATKTMRAMLPHATQAADLLRALANEQRLLILCNLTAGEFSVGELNERLPLSQSALSQHLAVLRETGIVATRRESQTIFYSLKDGPAARVIETLYSIYCR